MYLYQYILIFIVLLFHFIYAYNTYYEHNNVGQSNEEPNIIQSIESPCKRLTNQEYKERVAFAKKYRADFYGKLGDESLSKEEVHKIMCKDMQMYNNGVMDNGAFPDFINFENMKPEPLHCYLGLSTQHFIWL